MPVVEVATVDEDVETGTLDEAGGAKRDRLAKAGVAGGANREGFAELWLAEENTDVTGLDETIVF